MRDRKYVEGNLDVGGNRVGLRNGVEERRDESAYICFEGKRGIVRIMELSKSLTENKHQN